MSSTPSTGADRQLPRGHLLVLNRSFRRTLEAENKSPRTIEAYTDAVRLLASYCQAHGHPLVASDLEREHIQVFIADQLARWKPATAHNRYRGLHAFFKWAVTEGDLETNPMEGMRPPQLPEQPVEVVGPDHLARLLKTCEGRDFSRRRDTAIILLLVDTGMRRAECAGMGGKEFLVCGGCHGAVTEGPKRRRRSPGGQQRPTPGHGGGRSPAPDPAGRP
jgi:site-specific recombinase XerD